MTLSDNIVFLKLATCPPGTEEASLNITKAYCNSPIAPMHKKYLCFLEGSIYVQHITIEGLATASSIQVSVADVTVALLKFHDVEPCIK